MAVASNDSRPLLTGGLWFAAGAALAAGWYGLAGDSYVALALALDFVLIAAASWAARSQARQRDAHLIENTPIPSAAPASGGVANSSAPVKSVHAHRIVLAGVAVPIGLIALFQLVQQSLEAEPRESGGAAFGAVCLAFAFVWLVLARALHGVAETDLPEAKHMGYAFRDGQWASFAAAGGLMGAMFHPPLVVWTSQLLFAWVVALCAETVLRWIAPVLVPMEPDQAALAPIQLLLREIVFARGNPLGSMLGTIETRYGVTMRSSWAITFVKRAAVPLVAFMLLLLWASTSLVIVDMGQLGARDYFGRVDPEPLQPGLHFKLPWPCGRIRAYSVKTVRQAPIGFVEAEQPANLKEPRALLWTRGHAKEEFALVLGGGTELVVVNALLYYKIAEDPAGFMDYVYGQAAAEEALTAFAYRALMEETRGRTLDEVLSADRSSFARFLVESVRRQAREARLGLEVVDLALLNLHPPIEAAGSYLDVINARLEAHRLVTDATGKKQVALLAAQTAGSTAIAAAHIEGSRRVAEASSQAAQFSALSHGARVDPQVMRLRMWIEAQELALTGQRLFLVDPSLLGEGGELMLDTRPYLHTPLPAIEVPSTPSGAKDRE